MAYFISTSGRSVICYGGTTCSGTEPVELTKEHLITKARNNPDFTEFYPEKEVVEKPVVERSVRVKRKKRAKKKAK